MSTDLGRSLNTSVISTKIGKPATKEKKPTPWLLVVGKEKEQDARVIEGSWQSNWRTGYSWLYYISVATEKKFGSIFVGYVIVLRADKVIYQQVEISPCCLSLVVLQLCAFLTSLFRATHFTASVDTDPKTPCLATRRQNVLVCITSVV